MANPTNKGVGTGTAVVADYGVLNTVTDKFFKGLDDNAANKKLAKDRANLIQKKAIDHLSGKLGEYDSSKVLYQDQIPLYELHQKNRNYWNGEKMAEAMKDPAVMKQYMDTIADEKRQIANSVNSVKPFEEFYKSMNSPESGFSTDKKAKVASYLASAGATMAGAKEGGYLARDQVIGSIDTKMDAAFLDKGKVLYDFVDDGPDNATGKPGVKSKKYIGDKAAYQVFKNIFAGNSELLQDLELTYPKIPFDQQVEKYVTGYMGSRKHEFEYNKPANPRAPKSGDGDKKDPYKNLRRFKDKRGYGFTLADGKPIVNTSYETEKGEEPGVFWNMIKSLTGQKLDVRVDKENVKISPVQVSDVVKKGEDWYLRGFSTKSIYDPETNKTTTTKEDEKDMLIKPGESTYEKVLERMGLPAGTDLDVVYAETNDKQTKQPNGKKKMTFSQWKALAGNESKTAAEFAKYFKN